MSCFLSQSRYYVSDICHVIDDHLVSLLDPLRLNIDWMFGLSLTVTALTDPMRPSLLGLFLTMRSVQVNHYRIYYSLV
jgi:hypothetical protein